MTIDIENLKLSLRKTAEWFRVSGVMSPADGSWGVGERVLLRHHNATWNKTLQSFPAWTIYDDYAIIEQRRADCNLETAFMFLRMSEVLGDETFKTIGVNLLQFLFGRSGLLLRDASAPGFDNGVWQWSHIKWTPVVYWDDNSWMAILLLMIARHYPELNQRFELQFWGEQLVRQLGDNFASYMKQPNFAVEKVDHTINGWRGNLALPHWGALVIMALMQTPLGAENPDYGVAVDSYQRYLLDNIAQFTTSDCAYALLGALASWRVRGDTLSHDVIEQFAQRLLANVDPVTGNIFAQHYETPTGEHLVDLIYTLNWSLLALQELTGFAPEREQFRHCYYQGLNLVLAIQDVSPQPFVRGCWRGMYDLALHNWGGGDRFEGGANSIYTGWTNAPIAWVVANEISGQTLFDF